MLHCDKVYPVSVRVCIDLVILCIVLWQVGTIHELLVPTLFLNTILL